MRKKKIMLILLKCHFTRMETFKVSLWTISNVWLLVFFDSYLFHSGKVNFKVFTYIGYATGGLPRSTQGGPSQGVGAGVRSTGLHCVCSLGEAITAELHGLHGGLVGLHKLELHHFTTVNQCDILFVLAMNVYLVQVCGISLSKRLTWIRVVTKSLHFWSYELKYFLI